MDRDSDGMPGAAWAHGQVRLQTRGPVQVGALYVPRAADRLVLHALRRGESCIVLGPPRSGKTSLRLRAGRLLGEGTPGAVTRPALAVVHVELPLLSGSSPGAFYFTVMSALAAELGLPAAAATTAWQHLHGEPPAERLRRFVQEELLARREDPVVLVLDDIDALAGLGSRGLDLAELFAVLGALAEPPPNDEPDAPDADAADADETDAADAADETAGEAPRPRTPSRRPARARLCWCMLGAVDPASLLGGEVDPLPDALRVFVGDLRRDELDAFGPALVALTAAAPPDDPAAGTATWLDAVYTWTGGHPYFTQHLCQQLVARAPRGPVDPGELVERLALHLFSPPAASHQADPLTDEDADPCVRAAALRLAAHPQRGELLQTYHRVLGGELVPLDDAEPLHAELLLTGLCAIREDAEHPGQKDAAPRLVSRCPALRLSFSEDWVRAQEVRALLDGAAAGLAAVPTDTRLGQSPPPPPMRGAQLKTAQAWARKNPDSLRPADVQVLLTSLELARQEAEGRHQASAMALQRESREKTELRSALQKAQREADDAARGLTLRLRALTGLVAVLAVLWAVTLVWGLRRHPAPVASPATPLAPAPAVTPPARTPAPAPAPPPARPPQRRAP